MFSRKKISNDQVAFKAFTVLPSPVDHERGREVKRSDQLCANQTPVARRLPPPYNISHAQITVTPTTFTSK